VTELDLAVKTCTKCGKTKPLSDFYRHKGTLDGHHGWCKPCHRASTDAATAALRERMGEDLYRAHKADIVRRHRAKGRDARSRESRKAYQETLHELRRRHQDEFDALLRVERHKRGLS